MTINGVSKEYSFGSYKLSAYNMTDIAVLSDTIKTTLNDGPPPALNFSSTTGRFYMKGDAYRHLDRNPADIAVTRDNMVAAARGNLAALKSQGKQFTGLKALLDAWDQPHNGQPG